MHQGLISFVAATTLCFALYSPASSEAQSSSSNSGPIGYPYSQKVDAELSTNNPMVPYKERRSTFGALLSFGQSTFNPTDYDPDFTFNENYNDFYGNLDTPMLEGAFAVKFNLSFFSVSLDVGVGHAENRGRHGSALTVTPVRAGGTLALDGIFAEPYLVPYGFAGYYSTFYKEQLASQKVEGRTTPAPYFGGGIRIQLDWIDPSSSDVALSDHGLENTFLYFEGRYFGPTGDRVPDLSSPEDTPYSFNAGLAFEF